MSFQARKTSFIFGTQIKIFLTKSMSFTWSRSPDTLSTMAVHRCRREEVENNCWIKSLFLFSLHTKYSRSFVKLRLNPWCHVDCFTDVLATFLDLGTLQLRCCLWSVWEILDLIKNILKNIRWTKVLRVWNDMRVRNQCQNFHFWVNFLFKIKRHEVKLACKYVWTL